jgi:hypothetical protein
MRGHYARLRREDDIAIRVSRGALRQQPLQAVVLHGPCHEVRIVGVWRGLVDHVLGRQAFHARGNRLE